MKRIVLGLSLVMIGVPVVDAQIPVPETNSLPTLVALDPDPLAAMGGGQVEFSAIRRAAFTRLTLEATVSSLGVGITAATNVGPHLDARVFGNYFSVDHNLYKTGFRIAGNMDFANAGAMADIYPFHRVPLRISPGFLFLNQNRARVDIRAQQGATLTINNIDWSSSNTDPLYGTGRLQLGGSGFTITSGLGHIVSRSYKRFTFPFEAGVVFIRTPAITFDIHGEICTANQTQCQPAATFPTFEANLVQQLVQWNQDVAPLHVYPIVEGGVAYSFHMRGER
jgi:hypothetical protein